MKFAVYMCKRIFLNCCLSIRVLRGVTVKNFMQFWKLFWSWVFVGLSSESGQATVVKSGFWKVAWIWKHWFLLGMCRTAIFYKWPFFISGIRPDTGHALPDIQYLDDPNIQLDIMLDSKTKELSPRYLWIPDCPKWQIFWYRYPWRAIYEEKKLDSY